LENEIIYLSRNNISSNSKTQIDKILKTYHVVSFRRGFLLKHVKIEQSPLEKVEYLRILENDYKIQRVLVDDNVYTTRQANTECLYRKI